MASAFEGSAVMITGAGSGMGATTAIEFAREGADLCLLGRRREALEATAESIRKTGRSKVIVETCDVADEAQVERATLAMLEAFGKIDAAFNNAGVEGDCFVPIDEHSVANYRYVFDVNVLGVFNCMKHQIKAMKKVGRGAIVNNSSIAGLRGFAGMSIYAASKHAVVGLTRSAALEVAAAGIRINSIEPAVIRTDMFTRIAGHGSSESDMAPLHPMNRIGESNEIAAAVLFLCGPKASFITGVELPIDGGWTAK